MAGDNLERENASLHDLVDQLRAELRRTTAERNDATRLLRDLQVQTQKNQPQTLQATATVAEAVRLAIQGNDAQWKTSLAAQQRQTDEITTQLEHAQQQWTQERERYTQATRRLERDDTKTREALAAAVARADALLQQLRTSSDTQASMGMLSSVK